MSEDTQNTPEQAQSGSTPEVIELVQSPMQIPPRAFWYKINNPDKTQEYVTIIASTAATALDGLKQQFPTATYNYMGVSSKIIQVNGEIVL